MDGVWCSSVYNPTHDRGDDIKNHYSETDMESLLNNGQQTTLQLKDRPYDPYVWISRGNILSKLGFPELALGDLWKSQLLCNLAREACSSRLATYHESDPFFTPSNGSKKGDLALAQFGESYCKRNGKQSGAFGSQNTSPETRLMELQNALTLLHILTYQLLVGVLCDSECYEDAVSLLNSACQQFTHHPAIDMLRQSLAKCERRLEEWVCMYGTSKNFGTYTRRPYPWMDERHLARNEDVIADIQIGFGGALPNSLRTCLFFSSPMAGGALLPSNPMFGVIAMKNISKGELVVSDHFVFAGRDTHDFRPKTKVCSHCFSDIKTWTARCCPDCMTMHCSKMCAKWASTYHYALCGLDFNWLDSWARGKDPESRDPYANQVTLLVRFLAYAADNLDVAPLNNIYLSRFTAGYRSNSVTMPLSFTAMVVQPTKILEHLGIDVFKDLRYDTWVIQVLLDRIVMNYGCVAPPDQGLPFFLGGLYSMFNHSCESNLFNDPDPESYRAVPRLFAKRDIGAGEELTVSYIPDGLPYEERCRGLMHWFDPCLCPLCQEERG